MKPDGIHARNLKLAADYGTSDRTIRQWRTEGKPVDDAVEMANMMMVDGRSTEKMRARAEQILTAAIESPPPPGSEESAMAVDPDWKDIMESPSASGLDADTVDRLRKLRTFFMAKLEKATKVNNIGGIKLYTDQVIALENAIGKNQLLSKRLGIDAGELMRREAVEQFLQTLGFLLMRGVDDDLEELCPKLVSIDSPADIRPILEEHRLAVRFLRPFRGIIEQRSQLGLPEWFVDALVTAADGQVMGAKDALKL